MAKRIVMSIMMLFQLAVFADTTVAQPTTETEPIKNLNGSSLLVPPVQSFKPAHLATKNRIIQPATQTDATDPQAETPVDPLKTTSPDPRETGFRKPRQLQPSSQAATVPSAIEQALIDEASSSEKSIPQEYKVQKLSQFGYSFFRPDAQGFAPLTDIPVGPEYILGAGDRIMLTAWGSLDGSYELEIGRSGEILLPKVGSVKVSGVTFGQLPGLITAHLSKVFRDFQIHVAMGKLRMIKVYLVGEISHPGDYDISSLSSLINALSAAGGPTHNGSLRSIEIHRGGKLIEYVDLYDFFLKGDKSRDIRLQSGDTVFVPSIGPVAGIAGNVRRPAIFELKGEKTLKDLLALAGGIVPNGYIQRLQISRVEAHQKKMVSDVHLNPESSGKSFDEQTVTIPIQDMDLVKIFPIDSTLRGYVRLEGYVLRPGDYALKQGMTIDQLLAMDNLLPEYYTEAGQLIRLHPPDYHPEVLYFNVAGALAKDSLHNLELQEFDRIRIFSRWEMEEMPSVRITGEIQRPGEYRLFRNMRVRDLLMFAGNPRQTAFLKKAEITRINKTSSSITSFPIVVNLEEAIKGSQNDNILLEPHDELSVRKIPNWAEEKERYVTLKGEFLFPGVYPIFKGERLSSVIRRAGGFTPKAFLYGAKFTREPLRELQQKRMNEFVANAELQVNTKMTELSAVASTQEELASAKATLEGVLRNLQLLRAAKAEGRMVVQLKDLESFANSPYDIEVMGGDTLDVPQSSSSVTVLGRVVNPTSFVHLDQQTVEHYLNLAGGTTLDSEENEIYVIRSDGSIFSRQQYSSLGVLLGGGFFNEKVSSGDTIVVPQRFEKTAWLRTIKDITTIMSQVAITAGTVILGLR